jgi:hypothetical protein
MNTTQNGVVRKVITLLTFAAIVSAPVVGQNIAMRIKRTTSKNYGLVSKESNALNSEKNESTASIVL